MSNDVHVFTGKFEDEARARQYSDAQWEPEPGEETSDQDYQAWEDRNPSWKMRDDLGGIDLDEDCIETIYGPDQLSYLEAVVVDGEAANRIRVAAEAAQKNTLVLIYSEALGGFQAALRSTLQLTYHGKLECKR